MILKILNPHEFADDLKDSKIPFTMISTTFTKRIIIDETKEQYYYSSGGKLKMIELNLIKMVKNHCEGLNLRIKVNRSNINYIKHNDFNNGIYKKDIYEIDLNAAYWKLAYKYNYISKEIYYKGLNLDENGVLIPPKLNKWGNVCNHVSKMARLIALGNLAKTKTVFKFDGDKYAQPEKERSVLTENIFFKVSSETDSIMKMLSIIAGNDYLFYWVDAIFVRGKEAVERICDYITNELGMEFKIVPIYKMLKQKSYIILWDWKNIDKDGNMKPRPYVFSSMPFKQLTELLDIDKNLIYKEHFNNFITD